MLAYPKPGDRIIVIGRMSNEPVPIQVGTTGTIREVWNEGDPLEQVSVDWDPSPNGERRTLMLVPSDYRIVRRLKPDEEKGTP
jgi:hypothetical protein